MARGGTRTGVLWYLGTIQYGVVLFGGGGLWYLAARLTGFFWGDVVSQAAACAMLVALVLAESWWAHMPGSGNEALDLAVDVLTSLALAGFGMAIVFAIISWIVR